MKKIMISTSTLGMLITGVAVASWVIACFVARRRYKDVPPFCGEIVDIKIVRPNYKDATRNGSRIDFSLRLWGTGDVKTKIQSIYGTVVTSIATGMKIHTRPLMGKNPLKYNYVFRSGVDCHFDVCMYLDDIKPEDIDGDTLLVEVKDTNGKQHLFTKKSGVKTVYMKGNER